MFISFWVKVVLYWFLGLLGLSCVVVMGLGLRNNNLLYAASSPNASKGFKNDKKFAEFEIGISKNKIGIQVLTLIPIVILIN